MILRVLYPPSVLAPNAPYARRVHDDVLAATIAREQRRRRPRGARPARAARTRSTTRWAWILAACALALVPAGLLGGFAYWRFGREHATGTAPEYVHEPPDDLPAALVPSLLAQRVVAGGDQLAATLFELVRRGRFTMTHVTREESSFAGLRHKEIDDVDLARGDESIELAVVEKPVAADLRQAHRARARSRSRRSRRPSRTCRPRDREWFHGRSEAFESAVRNQARQRVFWSGHGMLVKWLSFVAFLLVGRRPAWSLGIVGPRRPAAHPPRPRHHGGRRGARAERARRAAAAGAACGAGAAPTLQASAEQWEGFRRYLDDFPRLAEKPADTLPLWERYLIYGIAFGIAERVLEAAKVSFPAIADSSVYVPGAVRPLVQRLQLRERPRRRVPLALERELGRRRRGRLLRRRRRRRLVTPSDEEHRALQAAAVEADAEAQRRLLAGDRGGRRAVPARVRAALPRVLGGRAAGRLRPPGRHAQGGDPARRRRARPRTMRGRRSATRAESPTAAYALALACLAADDDAAAGAAAAQMAAGGEAFERTAAALAALARRDEAAYADALRAVIADFESRDLHLTGVPIADTALVLERLAEPRGLAQRPVSPLLPPA